MTILEKHYQQHKEERRLKTRHGIVEFTVSMKYIHQYMPDHIRNGNELARKNYKILDIGAGTGKYSIELCNEGFDVTAVELVKRNLEILRSKHKPVKTWQGNALNLDFLKDNTFDLTLLFGPLYHLHKSEEKIQALNEAKRVTKNGGVIFVAYLMNEYSLFSYCFRENRIANLLKSGAVTKDFCVAAKNDELYDYVRLEDIDKLNQKSGLERLTIFSPDGMSDYMRKELNAMNEETFALFIDYQLKAAERKDLIGAGSHTVDVLRVIK
ncbi:MAG: class I SAM-dependent methyltransferase [Treponema sp.]|nr:class I SAM-dependent methyltransferase [Treponema sp.]